MLKTACALPAPPFLIVTTPLPACNHLHVLAIRQRGQSSRRLASDSHGGRTDVIYDQGTAFTAGVAGCLGGEQGGSTYLDSTGMRAGGAA